MEIRGLTESDRAIVKSIAEQSLHESYRDTLHEDIIDKAVAEWYATDSFDEYLVSDEMMFLLATVDDTVVGFSQSHVVEETNKGRILWIHVDPDYRGQGIATKLFNATHEALKDRGIDQVTGLVLADHEEGNEFYADQGFEKLYDREIEISGQEYVENVYGEAGTVPSDLVPWISPDGENLYIDYDDHARGSRASFFALYSTPDRTRRYGWFCSNCESADTAMDSMGHIECNECGNRRKATRWDAAYL